MCSFCGADCCWESDFFVQRLIPEPRKIKMTITPTTMDAYLMKDTTLRASNELCPSDTGDEPAVSGSHALPDAD